MGLIEVFAAFYLKFKEIKEKYGEDLASLEHDNELIKLSADYGRLVRKCCGNLSTDKVQDLVDELGQYEIHYSASSRRQNRKLQATTTILKAPNSFIRENLETYRDVILSDQNLVDEMDLMFANHEISLPSLGIESNRDKKLRLIDERRNAAKEELMKNKIESITFEYSIETYLNKLESLNKIDMVDPVVIKSKERIMKQFMGLVDFALGVINENNIDINKVVDELDISNNEKDILRRLNSTELANNKNALLALFKQEKVAEAIQNDFSTAQVDITYVENHVQRVNTLAQQNFDKIDYELAKESIAIENDDKKAPEKIFINPDNNNFLNFGEGNLFKNYSFGTMKLLDEASNRSSVYSADFIEWGTDFVAKAESSINYLTNKNNILNTDERFRVSAFKDVYGSREYKRDFGNLVVDFNGVNDKNIDMIVGAIASIKINHMNRPWYHKFFGYFGKIGNEMAAADRLAERVANEYHLDANLLKNAVNEKAGIVEHNQQNFDPNEKSSLDKVRDSVNKLELDQINSNDQPNMNNVYKYEDLTKDDRKVIDLDEGKFVLDELDKLDWKVVKENEVKINEINDIDNENNINNIKDEDEINTDKINISINKEGSIINIKDEDLMVDGNELDLDEMVYDEDMFDIVDSKFDLEEKPIEAADFIYGNRTNDIDNVDIVKDDYYINDDMKDPEIVPINFEVPVTPEFKLSIAEVEGKEILDANKKLQDKLSNEFSNNGDKKVEKKIDSDDDLIIEINDLKK